MALRSQFPLIAAAALLGCGARQDTPPVGYAGPDTEAFIVEHRAELEREIAVGSGSTIYDLSIVAGCQDIGELGRELRQRKDLIFGAEGGAPAVDDHTVAQRIIDVMVNNPEIRCIDLEVSQGRVFTAGRRNVGGVTKPGTAPRWR